MSEDEIREPWKCDACGLFVYNRDEEGNPIAGAPSAYFGGEYGSMRYEKICTACFEMKQVLMDLKTDYWRELQKKADILHNQRAQKLKEQGGGSSAI